MSDTGSDSRIPNDPIQNMTSAINIATDRLRLKYGTPERDNAIKIATRAGSSNSVDVYQRKFGDKVIKYAVRTGKDPSFRIQGGFFQRVRVTLLSEYVEYRDSSREKFLKETADSERNWRLADEKGLSPELYFYGYIKQGNNLVLCTISEAFNMDLSGFIHNHGFGNQAMQKNIATQLISLFNEMAKDMSMICFDIKPANTVIKFDQDSQGRPILNENFIIKLIDWDADWCRDYKFLRLRDEVPREANQKAAAIAMIMVMANFFYQYYNFNILSDYMKAFYRSEGTTFTITKVIMNLFEAGFIDGVNTTEFSFMAGHYFQMHFDSQSDDQSKFLIQMFKRAMCKNVDEYLEKHNDINITFRGGKKKKITRHRRKNKKTFKRRKRKTCKNNHKRGGEKGKDQGALITIGRIQKRNKKGIKITKREALEQEAIDYERNSQYALYEREQEKQLREAKKNSLQQKYADEVERANLGYFENLAIQSIHGKRKWSDWNPIKMPPNPPSELFNQYGKGKDDSLGEGTGRLSNSRITFKKNRIIVPTDGNRSIELKYDDRICYNWSANIRLPNGNLQYMSADGNAIWIPLKNFDNEYLDYLVSIFENFQSNSSFEEGLSNFLEERYTNISSINDERKKLRKICSTTKGGKKKKRKTKRKSIKKQRRSHKILR